MCAFLVIKLGNQFTTLLMKFEFEIGSRHSIWYTNIRIYHKAASTVKAHQPLANLKIDFVVVRSQLQSQRNRIKVAVNNIQFMIDLSLIIAIMINTAYVIYGMNIFINSQVMLRNVDILGSFL